MFGGRGGYAKGDVTLTAGTTIQIYVGQQGSGCMNSNWRSTGGGGATDFRLVGGNWNDNAGLLSRILVAGGGGGRHGNNYEGTSYIGNAGGGSSAPSFNVNGVNVVGSSQNSGGSSNNTNVPGSFGYQLACGFWRFRICVYSRILDSWRVYTNSHLSIVFYAINRWKYGHAKSCGRNHDR
ncbi:MAG: hypothetical protein EBV59_09225 [Synechococcaceae bacterium WB7_1C_051]|nr:hypothetical protein [Synechococcaceae bacterium WB7_1C_051]